MEKVNLRWADGSPLYIGHRGKFHLFSPDPNSTAPGKVVTGTIINIKLDQNTIIIKDTFNKFVNVVIGNDKILNKVGTNI